MVLLQLLVRAMIYSRVSTYARQRSAPVCALLLLQLLIDPINNCDVMESHITPQLLFKTTLEYKHNRSIQLVRHYLSYTRLLRAHNRRANLERNTFILRLLFLPPVWKEEGIRHYWQQ